MEKFEMSRKKIDEFNGNYWNQFNDVLALSDTDELEGLLRKCHLFYWLASETANGGIEQYFDTMDYFDQDEVLSAIKDIGAMKYYDLFKDALDIHSQLENIDEDDEELEDSLLEKLEEIDSKFYEEPDPFDFLQNLLKEKESELFVWVD